MLQRVDFLLAGQPVLVVGCLAFALILLLAGIDRLTGHELSISAFYLIPISVASWYGNRNLGYLVSVLSVATWMAAEGADAFPYSQDWILFWNCAVRLVAFVIVAYLLAELKAQLQRQRLLARTDNLTGLLNRTGFFERAKLATNAASRYGYAVAVAYIDLNGFKSINDTHGHLQGDEALRMIGGLLKGSSRDSDVVARLGGDEFVVLLPDTSLGGARAYFDKLHAELEQQIHARGWASLGLSIGAVVFEKAPADISDALRLADRLMYRAKKGGKTGVIVEDAGPGSIAAKPRSATVDA